MRVTGRYGSWERTTVSEEMAERTRNVLEQPVVYRLPLPFVLHHLSPLTADEFRAAAAALGGIPSFALVGRKPDGSVCAFVPRGGYWMPEKLLDKGFLELPERKIVRA